MLSSPQPAVFWKIIHEECKTPKWPSSHTFTTHWRALCFDEFYKEMGATCGTITYVPRFIHEGADNTQDDDESSVSSAYTRVSEAEAPPNAPRIKLRKLGTLPHPTQSGVLFDVYTKVQE